MKKYTVILSADQINRLDGLLEQEMNGYEKMDDDFTEDVADCDNILKALNKKKLIKQSKNKGDKNAKFKRID